MNQRFPLTANYDPSWINENKMGPNPLWLVEELVREMNLTPGMKVLDLGCGKGLTSIFLAKEFGVQVWASDLWIDPTENLSRIRTAGVESLVYPIKAEAHSMPFPDEFFDCIISIDAYHYFGTDELFLSWYLKKLVKKGSEIGIVVPGVKREVSNEQDLPYKLRELWTDDLYTFHTAEWWGNHWSKTKTVTINQVEYIKDSHNLWWQSNCDTELLNADEEELLTFVKFIATRIV
ncbi:SAM-dependent methyltransferase [Paenibacillus mendelii]|uniref:SAM-dependent methyltransferase n=1 Tax=Paenibacillus mendelii TaxID=206163 RepID=A0ABV6JDP3_9BACL|nr:methyltransferase domain-containing protein [Paenibacillus mendelii]MCQ6563514.1 methyltransferase domain-containing protein [Paenibacillus mendelii]